MEYVDLANSDLRVSRLAFGCEPLGGTDWGIVDSQAAIAAVRRSYELGINLFDTAAVYGLGRSEELLAEALGEDRKSAVIASKGGLDWNVPESGGRAKVYADGRRQSIISAVDGSLRRLRVEAIGLYYVHKPDPGTPLSETMAAMADCQRAGKIRHVGVSNFSAEQIREAHDAVPLTAVQVEYSLLSRSSQDAVIPCCRELGLSVLVYGPLGQGVLTGKYGRDARFGENDRRSRLLGLSEQRMDSTLRVVGALTRMAGALARTPAQTGIRWVLDAEGIACAIVGAKTPSQVEENVGATGWRLTPDEWRRLGSSQ